MDYRLKELSGLALKTKLQQTKDNTDWLIHQCRSILQAATNQVTDWQLRTLEPLQVKQKIIWGHVRQSIGNLEKGKG